jgi:3-hydroxyisobutyrate dehydrogenase-like beta-hydroxyacid dehydrogenase
MVTDDAAVEAVYSEDHGLLKPDVRGKIFADLSTILPDTVKRVATAVLARGGAFVDAPVAGTIQPAREGRLLIFAGGRVEDLEPLRPAFTTLARRVEHLGPVGSGAAMKLVHNALLSTYWGILAESMAMGSRYGLDFKRMLSVIAESPASFGALAVKMPMLLGQAAEVGFNIANVRKDLRAIEAFGETIGVPIHIAGAALETYESAIGRGFAEEDVGAIVQIERDLHGGGQLS